MLDGNFKIRVVKKESFLVKVVDPLRQLWLQVVCTPPCERLLQKHLQAGPVYRDPEFHWAAFFQTGEERSVRILETENGQQPYSSGQNQAEATASYARAGRKKQQARHAAGKG